MAELVAVVDLGSTAVRMVLARVTPDTGYRVLAEERVPTRLGGGTPGALPRDAIDETLRAVHRFFARYFPAGRHREGPAHPLRRKLRAYPGARRVPAPVPGAPLRGDGGAQNLQVARRRLEKGRQGPHY